MWTDDDEREFRSQGCSLRFLQISAAGNGKNGIYSTSAAARWAWHNCYTEPIARRALEVSVWTPFEDGLALHAGFWIMPYGGLVRAVGKSLIDDPVLVEEITAKAKAGDILAMKAVAEVMRRKLNGNRQINRESSTAHLGPNKQALRAAYGGVE